MAHTDHERDADKTKVERHDPLLGTLLNRQFRIVERIAAGGFGAIYRARHLDSACDVAIKVLLPELASNPNLVARFRREGATLATLCNPNTVRTFEFGEIGCPEAGDGMLYIVMELLRGETLFERYRARGAMPWSRATTIARAICNSLGEAHALGIVHRDLKPANIFLMPHGGDDHVKVLDFGIAKIMRSTGGDEVGDLTQVGQMIGTSDYMSPEQILGGTVDGRSDLYTLGVLMYELVTGRRPFQEAVGTTGMLAALLTNAPPSPSLFARIPPFLEFIIQKCLAREAQDRFADVNELAAALDHLHATHNVSQTDRVPPLPQRAGPARNRMARGSQHIVPGHWPEFSPAPVVPPPQPPVRGSQLTIPTYEMTHVVHRDTVVRRVIWGLVLAIACAFVFVVTNLL
jgi:serine/threonine protein kinase